MIYRVHDITLPIEADEAAIKSAVAARLRLRPEEIRDLCIARRSLDARKKPVLSFVYTLDVALSKKARLTRAALSHLEKRPPEAYRFPACGSEALPHRPVVIGSGPAGLFAAYLLSLAGFCPLLLERGDDALTRTAKVQRFFEGGVLDPASNVQFGEGGAGTFSDGKLNTSVKDPDGRGRFVKETFVRFGADPAILYEQKPHLGTDVLTGILLRMRAAIEAAGGEVRFRSKVSGLKISNGHLCGLEVTEEAYASASTLPETGSQKPSDVSVKGGKKADPPRKMVSTVPAEAVVLAPGHSARDTFGMLLDAGIAMEAKAFAMGVRIEHPQSMIDLSQYGRVDARKILGPAAYKLTHTAKDGRGVYSFCMCPGGYVVNASSEAFGLCVNGMSYHDRGSSNANSALLVTVSPKDYIPLAQGQGEASFGQPVPESFLGRNGSEAFRGQAFPEALSGVVFQRFLERRAFFAADGKVVQQLFADFAGHSQSTGPGAFGSCLKGQGAFGDVRGLLPDFVARDIEEGIGVFGKKIRGFDRPDAILSGIESRSSSPVRILRGESLESSLPGLYPAGEGAGYAGGIMSAAMDGLRVAEAIIRKYMAVDK